MSLFTSCLSIVQQCGILYKNGSNIGTNKRESFFVCLYVHETFSWWRFLPGYHCAIPNLWSGVLVVLLAVCVRTRNHHGPAGRADNSRVWLVFASIRVIVVPNACCWAKGMRCVVCPSGDLFSRGEGMRRIADPRYGVRKS